MTSAPPRQHGVAEPTGLPGTAVPGHAERSAGPLKLLLRLTLRLPFSKNVLPASALRGNHAFIYSSMSLAKLCSQPYISGLTKISDKVPSC